MAVKQTYVLNDSLGSLHRLSLPDLGVPIVTLGFPSLQGAVMSCKSGFTIVQSTKTQRSRILGPRNSDS